MFSSRFMLFPTLKKKLCKKKNPGGGGGVMNLFFIFLNSFSFHILCYFQNIKNILKSAPSHGMLFEFFYEFFKYWKK